MELSIPDFEHWEECYSDCTYCTSLADTGARVGAGASVGDELQIREGSAGYKSTGRKVGVKEGEAGNAK